MWTRNIASSIVFTFVAVALVYGQSEEQVAAGRAVYEARCATCHMLTGEPVAAMERAFNVEMRDLASEEVQAKEAEAIESDILEGTGAMRPITNLDDNAVAGLIAYIRSLAEGGD
jgi:mono/diheme cytochrome c family protein